jgi:hemoglobin
VNASSGLEAPVWRHGFLHARISPQLKFLAAVVLHLDSVRSIGETPDGVRMDFMVHGTVRGPLLNGHFPQCGAYLLIDVDGIGTISVRAPLLLNDGALAELEATGRYDFGRDGYRRAKDGDLPNSALGWCPRFLTGHPQYTWLNRTLCLGVGELRPRETRVDYDLFALEPQILRALGPKGGVGLPEAPERVSLYKRLGGKAAIDGLVSDFIDGLLGSVELNRQNPKVGAAHARVNLTALKKKVADLFCRLAGGPCEYSGRSLKAVHAPLDITEADWAIAAQQLVKILNEHNIPRSDQDELLAAIATTKSDIVTKT